MKTLIITAHTYQEFVVPWWAKAINNPEIARFINICPYYEAPELKSDWEQVLVMDENKLGLLKFNLDRGASRTAFISCWVLDCPNKKLIAGYLMKAAWGLAKRYGVRFVEWTVHGSNTESLRISRRRGRLVAYRPLGAWDSKVSQWVAQYTFSIDMQDSKPRPKPKKRAKG